MCHGHVARDPFMARTCPHVLDREGQCHKNTSALIECESSNATLPAIPRSGIIICYLLTLNGAEQDGGNRSDSDGGEAG